MIRTGVDMIEVSRIEQAAARFGDQFYKRFFTEGELAYSGGRPATLAARFAAKEAVAKALGTGIGDVRWVEIEVVVMAANRSRPELVLHGDAAALSKKLGLTEWSLSLAHTHEHAIAFVVAVGR